MDIFYKARYNTINKIQNVSYKLISTKHLKIAIKNGNIENIEWLIKKGSELNSRMTIDFIVINESENIEWLINNGYKFNTNICYYFAEKGDFKTVREMNKEQKYMNKGILEIIYKNDNTENLEWLEEIEYPYEKEECFKYAIKEGNFKVMEWLLEKNVHWNEDIIYNAIESGNEKVFDWLEEKLNFSLWLIENNIIFAHNVIDDVIQKMHDKIIITSDISERRKCNKIVCKILTISLRSNYYINYNDLFYYALMFDAANIFAVLKKYEINIDREIITRSFMNKEKNIVKWFIINGYRGNENEYRSFFTNINVNDLQSIICFFECIKIMILFDENFEKYNISFSFLSRHRQQQIEKKKFDQIYKDIYVYEKRYKRQKQLLNGYLYGIESHPNPFSNDYKKHLFSKISPSCFYNCLSLL
jgi:hypothetical protein